VANVEIVVAPLLAVQLIAPPVVEVTTNPVVPGYATGKV
jgi:hypothetical protein